jgi:hypothetical protein
MQSGARSRPCGNGGNDISRRWARGRFHREFNGMGRKRGRGKLDSLSPRAPGGRPEVIARLLGRPEWTTAPLDAVETGTVPAAVIPPSRRALLQPDRVDVDRDAQVPGAGGRRLDVLQDF